MRRDLTRICADRHDVVVVGGGIYGACVAWEAALRGLKVALVEARDFGSGTSSNSLRTLHGGLRHLQRLDFARMRESIRERREWLRLAPHLTRPLRFVLPTRGHALKGPEVMWAALRINDLVSLDRNRDLRADHRLPRGCVWSRQETLAALPGLNLEPCNGAAVWHDGVCLNTERLHLAVLTAAAEAGAQVANYLKAVRLRVAGEHAPQQVRGIRVCDELTGREMDLHARSVINAAGPWVDEWLDLPPEARSAPMFHASKAFNLLTRPLPFTDAVGLSVPARPATMAHAAHTYFILPWNGYSLIGTRHLRCEHSARRPRVTREEVQAFLAELNYVLGKHRLAAADICGVFAGLLPEVSTHTGLEVALERAPQVIRHARRGVRGLVSVVGVKWTTARAVAQRAVAEVCREIGLPVRRLESRDLRLPDAAQAVQALVQQEPDLAFRIVEDLPVTMGDVVHAARAEMAIRLSDVILRRTPLYLSEGLDRPALTACASALARELRWSRREIGTQVEEVESQLAAFRRPAGLDLKPAAA